MPSYCSVELRGLPTAVRTVTVGSNLRVRIYVTGDDRMPVDPTEVTLTVRDPSGTDTTPALNNYSVGNYYADVDLSESGVWLFRAVASGSHADADEHRITVPASAFT